MTDNKQKGKEEKLYLSSQLIPEWLRNYLRTKLYDSHLEELFEGSSIAFVLKVVGKITGYLFMLLVTRKFGAYTVGIYALSLTVLEIFAIIGKLGFDGALLRFASEYSTLNRMDLAKKVYQKILKFVIPECVLLSMVLFYFSSYIATNLFHKEYLSSYLRIAAIALLPMVLIVINLEGLRGLKKIKEYSFLQSISIPLFASIILIVLLFFINGIYLPFISHIGSIFIVCIISFIIWIRCFRNHSAPDSEQVGWKALFNVSLPMFLSGSLFLIMGWTDNIMLGIYRSESEVGIYSIVLKIFYTAGITGYAINVIAAPKFAELYASRDKTRLGSMARQTTKLISWTSFPILAIFLILPSFILGFFGHDFRNGSQALRLLVLGQFVNVICGPVGLILLMTGKQHVFQVIVLFASLINLVLNVLLVPAYGINGAAFASMVSLAFWNICSVIYIKSYLNILTVYLPMVKMRVKYK